MSFQEVQLRRSEAAAQGGRRRPCVPGLSLKGVNLKGLKLKGLKLKRIQA
jgi:hypothetical protein